MSTQKNPILTITLFALIAIFSIFKIINYDIWFELKYGEAILKDLSAISTELFSFTASGTTFVNQEWLSEVLFFLIYQGGGITGLIIFKVFVVLAIFGLLFKFLKEQGVDPLVIFWMVLLTFLLARFRLIIRPHLFTFFFLVLFQYLLDAYKKGERKHLFILPALMILWTNLHFGSLLGIILVGIYAVGLMHQSKHILVVLWLCLLAAMINPGGYHFYTLFLTIGSMAAQFGITETKSPLFVNHALIGYPLFWFTLIGYTLLVIKNRAQLDVVNVLTFAFGCVLALKMIRFIPIFALLSAPIVATLPIPKIHWLKNKTAFAILFIALAAYANSNFGLLKRYDFGFGINDRYFPKEAIAFLEENKVEGNTFNDLRYGGPLVFERAGANPVFIYGRYTALGEDIFKKYFHILSAQEGWETMLRDYQANIIILDNSLATVAPLMLSLSKSPDWKLIYMDAKSVIIVRDIPAFEDVIQRHNYSWEMEPV